MILAHYISIDGNEEYLVILDNESEVAEYLEEGYKLQSVHSLNLTQGRELLPTHRSITA